MLHSHNTSWIFKVALISCATVSAYGQATRTWVSGTGDDANPCSRTAPCKTFAGAISKTAPLGEINVIDPGGYGAVTITKSMTIDASPVLSGILVSAGGGVVINAGANDIVVLRGLDFNGLGTASRGIQIISAGKVYIDNCQIYGFNPRGISVEPTTNPVQVFINNTAIRNSTSNGLVVAPATGSILAQVTLNNVTIAENTNFGISVTGGSQLVIRDSSISNNGFATSLANIRADGGAGVATIDMDNVMVNGSAVGIMSLNNAVVRVNNSSIIMNTTGLSPSAGGAIQSFQNNRLVNTTNGAFTATIGVQ